jgi:hypothetical protein
MSKLTAVLQSLIEANDPGDAHHKAVFHKAAADALSGHIAFAKKRGEHAKTSALQRQRDLHLRAHHIAVEKAKTFSVDEATGKPKKTGAIEIHPRANEEDEALYRANLHMMLEAARYGWADVFKEHLHRALDHKVHTVMDAMRVVDAHERFGENAS